jgi:hypothetical protein
MDEQVYNGYSAINPAFLMTMLTVFSALTILYIISMWKIFTKAGQPGWAAIIPIYNIYVLLKIVGKPGYWLLLMLIPFVNIVFAIWSTNMLSKSFGKDEGFTVGLLLLGFVFYPILAFGSAKYEGPYGDRFAFEAYRERNKFQFENESTSVA